MHYFITYISVVKKYYSYILNNFSGRLACITQKLKLAKS